MPNPPFDQPEPYSPDNVIGDELSEIQPAPPIVLDPVTATQPSLEVFPAPPLPVHPPAPPIVLDPVTPTQPAPVIVLPPSIPAQPAPAITLPPSLPDQPAPPLTADPPTPLQPAPSLTANPPSPPQPAPPINTENYVPPPLDFPKMVARIRFSDSLLATALSGLGVDPFALVPGGPGSNALDPQLYGKSLVNLGNAIGRDGMLRFIATQVALYAMNAETSKVFDPGYFLERAPILNGITRLTLDTETHEDIVRATEELRIIANEQALTVLDKTGLPIVQAPVTEMGDQNTNGPENRYEDAAMFSIGGLVDAALIDLGSADSIAASQVLENDSALARFRVPKNAFFDDGRVKLGKPQDPKIPLNARTLGRAPVTRGSSAALARSAYAGGIVPAGFKQDGIDGLVRTRGDAPPSTVVDDDDAYVPLSFTDLRKVGNENRSVFFRPFITSLNESFAPSYEEGSFFGRVDPVVRYQSTTRTINLGFELHAFSPEDLDVIYKKLHWLSSLVYPEFDKDLLFKSGPVCKMRIGDLIGSSAGGQSGVIQSLDFDYTDALWELKKGMKVPRSIPVSLSFLALHGGPLGIIDGKFGVISLSDPEQQNDGDNLLERTRKAATGRSVNVGKIRGFGDPEIL